jgi:group I intron endonuclease
MKKYNCGVYKITNKINGKCYIGSSIDIRRRKATHFRELSRGTHGNSYLQRAWYKYGCDAFEFKTVLICSKENVIFYEQIIMDLIQPCIADNGYNAVPNAGNIHGYKHTEDARMKISIARTGKGIIPSEETRKRMSLAHKGKTFSDKARQNMRNARKLMNKQVSQETRGKISKANKGRKASHETRMKLIEAAKARPPRSDEHKMKLSLAHTGKTSPMKGKKLSAEAKAKRRESMIAKGTYAKLGARNKKDNPEMYEEHSRKMKELFKDSMVQVRHMVSADTGWAKRQGRPFSYIPNYQNKYIRA